MANAKSKDWLTPKMVETLGLLPYEYEALRRMFKEGIIPSIKENGRYYTKKEWIDQYIESKKSESKNGE